MVRRAQNPFERVTAAHNKLVAKTPVGRTALLNSLASVESAGNAAVKAQKVGVIKFAIAMSGINTKALELNSTGNVQPPFSEAEAAAIEAKNETFQIFIDNDPGSGTAPAPTDPSAIPTTARKGA